jgi:hypothetical protein
MCRLYGFTTESTLVGADKPPITAGDQAQPLVRSMFISSLDGGFKDKNFWDIGLGGDIPVSPSSNLRGYFRSRFITNSKSFDLLNTDYYGGVNTFLTGKTGTWELYLYHLSSHMGDEVLLDTATYSYARNNYSREVVKLSYYTVLFNNISMAYSFHYILRKDPVFDGNKAVQCDIEIPASLWNKNVTFSIDLTANEEHNWNTDICLQMRLNLKHGEKNKYRQQLTIEYYDGYSKMGQLYYMKEKYVSIGVIACP